MVRNVAVRLAFTDACHPSSVISSNGPGGVRLAPALATRMSIGPKSFSIRSRIDSMSERRVTSPVTCITLPPARSISPCTAANAPSSRPCTTTFAPSCAKSFAIAAPIPRELPVTRATLSARAFTGVLA